MQKNARVSGELQHVLSDLMSIFSDHAAIKIFVLDVHRLKLWQCQYFITYANFLNVIHHSMQITTIFLRVEAATLNSSEEASIIAESSELRHPYKMSIVCAWTSARTITIFLTINSIWKSKEKLKLKIIAFLFFYAIVKKMLDHDLHDSSGICYVSSLIFCLIVQEISHHVVTIHQRSGKNNELAVFVYAMTKQKVRATAAVTVHI